MELPQTLVDLPAREGARRLALTHLEAAHAARTRVAASADPEALHDYRVALRRLRSCFRSYRPELRSTVTRTSRGRLDRIARATNRSRDLEVHLDWLAAQAAAADERLFPSLYERLSRELQHYRLTVRLGEPEEPPTTATVAAQHLERAARRLDERLRRIEGEAGETEIHRARIAAKHLRYLLEPFGARLPGGDGLIERLKGFQDAFGDVHDAHVFLPALRTAQADAERDLRVDLGPGLRSLARSLRARALEAFGSGSREWLDQARRASFFEEVRAAGKALARHPRRGREVERKYLLSGLPPAASGAPSVEIEQGYLPGERLIERLRRIRGEDGVELVRTMKEGSGLVRLEVEESVAPDVFDALWPLTTGRRLRKRRYRVADGELTWEIDQFLDRDLVLAEVELPAPEVEVAIPAWLGPWVQREVTDDPAYDNVELSRAPVTSATVSGA
jgi:CHAD domain-containing protein/CYTH domain-containing protein